jgi:hypothetical protein
MPTFKFYTNPSDKANKYEITANLIGRDWDFSDGEQSKEFSTLYRKYLLGLISSPEEKYYKFLKSTIDNFELLKTFTADTSPHPSIANRNCDTFFDNTVGIVNRGKKKTIIALGGGSWYKTLYNYDGLDHVASWLFDERDSVNYNVISFREQIERCYYNPVLYDSCYYNGCHEQLTTPQAMAAFIKQLFPDNEYYIFGDCKLGHATALLAYYLGASKIFVSSGITTMEIATLDTFLNKNNDGDYHLNDYQSLGAFEVLLRATYFSDNIPSHLMTTQNIINLMPNSKFMFYNHEHDIPEFNEQSKMVSLASNVNIHYTDNQKYSINNHHIVNYLRKHNIVFDFFNE